MSRTRRKNYENYVINAIWNRLSDDRVFPVTQQYIKKSDGSYYLIDLYFPQIKVGIECDEGYHKKNQQNDIEREMTIFDVLKQIDTSSFYTSLHVDVTKSYTEVEQTINSHVQVIKTIIKASESSGNILLWDERDASSFFKDRSFFSVADNVTFKTITEVCNIVFGKNYTFMQQSYFSIEKPRKIYAWFPKLAINGKSVSRGWNNMISNDGKIIWEYNDDNEINIQRARAKKHIGEKRITFTQVKNPTTKTLEYRFVGQFKLKGYDDAYRAVYELFYDKLKIKTALKQSFDECVG